MVIQPAKIMWCFTHLGYFLIHPVGEHDDKPMDLGTVAYYKKQTTMMEKSPAKKEMGWKWKLRWTGEMIYWDKPEITVLHVISTYSLWSALSRYRHKHHSFAKKSCGARHLRSELLSMPCKPSWSRRWIPGCWCSTSVLLDVLLSVWLLESRSPRK